MKITGAKLSLSSLHTHEPFKIAYETYDLCHSVILELLTDEGLSGFGEAAPARRITGETTDTVILALKAILLPAVMGCDAASIEEIHGRMDDALYGNPAAKAAIDFACYDLIGKKLGQSMVSLLGGKPGKLLTDHTIGIKPPEEQAAKARELVKAGYTVLKVKLGTPGHTDIERIKQIREAVGPEIKIRIDANQGWSVKQALEILEEIAPLKIELAEQPVAASNLKGLAYLKKYATIPIAADEAVHSPRDADMAIAIDACHIINIKLMKCGGIFRAAQIALLAEQAGLECMIGGMIGESRLAVTAAAHFAASRPIVKYYDLDADLLLKDELVEKGGIEIKDGYRIISDAPGLGIEKFFPKFLSPWESFT